MNRKYSGIRHVNRIVRLLIPALLLLLLAGCGTSHTEELEHYRTEMAAFYDTVSAVNTNINNIDPESSDAHALLLSNLRKLNDACNKMAALKVPEEFSEMGDLPAETAEYMNKAYETYMEAYEGETFDPDAEARATEYYERANVRIRYMLAILHGETGSNEGG